MKTDNELIAEFMGFTFAYERGHKVFNVPKGEEEKYKAFKLSEAKMNYDTSWDWLMPVVEKIASLKNPVYIYVSHIQKSVEIFQLTDYTSGELRDSVCRISDTIVTPIQATHKAVVEFIKWYNQQNP